MTYGTGSGLWLLLEVSEFHGISVLICIKFADFLVIVNFSFSGNCLKAPLRISFWFPSLGFSFFFWSFCTSLLIFFFFRASSFFVCGLQPFLCSLHTQLLALMALFLMACSSGMPQHHCLWSNQTHQLSAKIIILVKSQAAVAWGVSQIDAHHDKLWHPWMHVVSCQVKAVAWIVDLQSGKEQHLPATWSTCFPDSMTKKVPLPLPLSNFCFLLFQMELNAHCHFLERNKDSLFSTHHNHMKTANFLQHSLLRRVNVLSSWACCGKTWKVCKEMHCCTLKILHSFKTSSAILGNGWIVSHQEEQHGFLQPPVAIWLIHWCWQHSFLHNSDAGPPTTVH